MRGYFAFEEDKQGFLEQCSRKEVENLFRELMAERKGETGIIHNILGNPDFPTGCDISKLREATCRMMTIQEDYDFIFKFIQEKWAVYL